MKNKILTSVAILLSAVLLASCSSTRLISSWSGTIAPNVMDKVIVFSLLSKSDNTIQDNFEDAIVANLRSHGANAVSAFDTFGPDALKKADKDKVAKFVRDGRYTGVLVITLLDKQKNEDYVPPTTTTVAVPAGPAFIDPWFHPYYACYNYYYDQVTTPGYWTETTSYVLEARLFNAQDENDAIYIAKTVTTDPSDPQTMSAEFAKTVVSDMKSKGILKK